MSSCSEERGVAERPVIDDAQRQSLRRPCWSGSTPDRGRSFSLGTAVFSVEAPEFELTRHVKEINFPSAIKVRIRYGQPCSRSRRCVSRYRSASYVVGIPTPPECSRASHSVSFFAASFATSYTASGRHVTLMGGRRSFGCRGVGLPVAAGATARMCVARRAVFILTCEREPGQGHREMSGAVKEIGRLLSRPQTFCGLVAIALCFVHKPSPFTPRRVSGRSHLEWRL